MAKKKASWGLIILGSAIFIVVVGVGLIAVAGYFIYQQFAFQATTATAVSAEEEFTKAAARFTGQRPLLEIVDGEPKLNKERVKPGGKVAKIEALHLLVWQPDERKLVKLNIPFWILRMTRGRPIRLGSRHGDQDEGRDSMRLNITAAELESYGPGLVIDHIDEGGDRVLVWAR